MAAPVTITTGGVRSGPQTVGDLLRLTAVFVDPDTGGEVEPTTVRFKFLPPGERQPTTYLYDTDDELVSDETGLFYTDFPLDFTGVYSFRWECEGTYQGAVEFTVTVAPSPF